MRANVYIYGPFVVWFVAQLIKFIIGLVRGKADFRYLFSSGGMPSAHAAVVCSLATITLLDQGATSPLFGITAILAAIVMYDSFGVRRSSGEQAHTLNQLISDLNASGALRRGGQYESLREILGHKPNEVLAGAILGIVGGALFEWNKFSAHAQKLVDPFTKSQLMILAYIAVGLAFVSLILRWWNWQKYGKNKKIAKLSNRPMWFGLGSAVLYGLLIFASYQQASYLQYRLVIILVFLAIEPFVVYTYIDSYKKIRELVKTEQLSSRRDKWLKKAKKK